ncbi:hypothetical protein [Sulfitobacter sp. 20_GPM-1509m]|uniref:hypothetical protein n=1 Tax=Sulfitobacter sp. 20_GPM-1509m TaxID=1380367 RepID=UPI0012DE5DDB|nr:hypothetical protein [Sulfitobacter sp. 20_GPM-1509m]
MKSFITLILSDALVLMGLSGVGLPITLSLTPPLADHSHLASWYPFFGNLAVFLVGVTCIYIWSSLENREIERKNGKGGK